MERYFSALKAALCNPSGGAADAVDYMERFYSPTRKHSTLGNVSPVVFEQAAGVA